MAAEGAGKDNTYRAIVVGDVSLFSDSLLQASQGNAQFALDGIRWLVGDEALAGSLNNEEDVKIQHTAEEDKIWFWGTILIVPLLIFGLGAFFIRSRRSSS